MRSGYSYGRVFEHDYGNVYRFKPQRFVQVDIVKSDWRDLDELGKKAWLLDCLNYSGTNPKLLDKNQFILECDSISHELDFYCLIGEVLCGKGGYLGRDLDGIQDCLSAIRFDGRVLEIKNLDKLAKLLNTKNYNWTDRIIEILNSRFEVVLS